MFKPPMFNGTMPVLDRSRYKLDTTIAAARVSRLDRVTFAALALKKARDFLEQPRCSVIRDDPTRPAEPPARQPKCILLRPAIIHNDRNSWSETVAKLVDDGEIDLVPYDITFDYDNWDKISIIDSVLPDHLIDQAPTGYNAAGHIAQVNLDEPYLPFKHLIGQIFLDKTPGIRTVINKIETMDEEDNNDFRLIKAELLAGDDDMMAEVTQGKSRFRFDFSKVFWNSRLATEHERIAEKCQKGEAVCDVMAGVGPFAIRAARKGCFVWANDLNPACYDALIDSANLNKVDPFIKPFNQDGRDFITAATQGLLETRYTVRKSKGFTRREIIDKKIPHQDRYNFLPSPRTFSHYIMNLPGTADDFLPSFIGLYADHELLFAPVGEAKLPMIHFYCFVYGPEDSPGPPEASDPAAQRDVCARISEKLGHEINPSDDDVEILSVRHVAPRKCQFRISFRLPPEVAFRRI